MAGIIGSSRGAVVCAWALSLGLMTSSPAAVGESISSPGRDPGEAREDTTRGRTLGLSEIFTDGFESGDTSQWGATAACPAYVSTEEEYSPVQIAGAGLPARHDMKSWYRPTIWTRLVPFSGVPGQPAAHEGTDYVHDDAGVPQVPVRSAADGQVVYVRLGCPQTSEFTPNTLLRECGAGWGNHVVVLHGHQIYTRYAHLKPGQTLVAAGAHVLHGEILGLMGNSGRSNIRHLHFELGVSSVEFDPCVPAQSMDLVFDAEALPWQ